MQQLKPQRGLLAGMPPRPLSPVKFSGLTERD
jgi:hypothetical protein